MAWAEKGYFLSKRCQLKKIQSIPSGGDNHKSHFQKDVPITIE